MDTIFDMPEAAAASKSSRWRSVAIFVAADVLFFPNLIHPAVRLSSPDANEIIGTAVAFLLPWLTVMAIFRMGFWWSKAIAIIAILPMIFYSALVFLAALWMGFAQNGRDRSFDRFSDLAWKRSHIRLYRTNGGATTDFGVVIRQERTLLPGLALVRRIDSYYHCYSLVVSPADSGIALTDPKGECQTFAGPKKEYRLKPFVYF